MNKSNKQLLYGIGAVLVVFILFIYLKGSNVHSKPLALVETDESILEQGYITLWGDRTDGGIDNKDVFHSCSKVSISESGQDLSFNSDRTSGSGCTFAKKFKGQEIVMLIGEGVDFTGTGAQCDSVSGRTFCVVPSVLLLQPHTFESTKWDLFRNGRFVKVVTTDDSGFLTLSLNTPTNVAGYAYYIGYKAQFSCDLSQNERWIETQWQGSVSIDDVISKDGFIPTKFCKETRPFVLRNLQQGETAIYPDPIPEFNRGCYVPNGGNCKTPGILPSNQLIILRYAVYQVPGLENPTTGTQAYVCDQRDSSYKCLKWSIKEVIKPLEIVVQCKVNDDCPLPLTKFQNNECLGYFKGCQKNKCVYDNTILEAPKCQNQVVTIVKQIQEVDRRTFTPVTGINVFTFSQNINRQSFNIGDETFTATPSQYLCVVPTDSDFLNPPSPSSECWKTTISYGGNAELKDTQSVYLDTQNIIKIQYFASGKLTRGKYNRPEDWSNTFIFTVDNSKALNLDVEDSGFVIKDSIKKINMNIINNLPAGEILIKFQQKVKATNQNLPEQSITRNINEGVNSFSIDMDTRNLGLNVVTMQIFYKVAADTEVLIPSDKFIINYDVVTELPSVTKIVEVEKIVEKERVIFIDRTNFITNFFSKIIAWLKSIFS